MSTTILDQYIQTVNDIKNYSEFVEWVNLLSKQITVDPAIRVDKHYVYGCQVATWFTYTTVDNKLHFSFDSDSTIVKGIVKILLDVIEGLSPQEIKNMSFYEFRKITSRLPIAQQRTLQIILNKAHEFANTTGDAQ
jgi:sulfur transfer protein SufE